jgi:2-polyprenyl-3-methyl-5-hydroxy-6-metoxy-1,4-benzoquinol methylase
MTAFELAFSIVSPFEHPLHRHVRNTLRRLPASRILDVGGRRSNYTIGLKSEVWISDVPREREIQKQLDLGATDAIRSSVLGRRSNVKEYKYDDMTRTTLPAEHFDVVNAVEVLEHVEEDEKFVANVAKVLKPGGHFVMTTPNGDFRPVPYPDHKRHYKAAQLEALLKKYFREVKIEYRVNADKFFTMAYKSGAVLGMFGYGMSGLLEKLGVGGRGPMNKNHLFAVCRK